MPAADRAIARLVAIKRLCTGSAEIVGAAVLAAIAARHPPLTPLVVFGIALFFGAGVWTLGDGIRLRRLLRQTSAR